jgi:outer membrane receptor for ferrienterochelin and colicins
VAADAGHGHPAEPTAAAGAADVATPGETPAPASDAPDSVEEIVVTGAKTAEGAWEATVPVQVISRERIEELSTTDVEDVLREIPGIYVRRNEQFGLGASTIRMQGADANKVAILIDGRRFRGGADGVVDLRDIPVTNIERVEILRGPASSLYGSDAMAGVVNFVTRSGSEDPVAEAVASWGSFDRQFYSATGGWQTGPLRWFVSGSHDELRLAEQFGDISAQFADEDEKQKRDQATLRLYFDAGDTHEFTVSPSFLQETNPDSRNHNLVGSGEWRWRVRPDTDLTTWLNAYLFDRTNDLPGFEEDRDYRDLEGESRLRRALGPWWAWDENDVTLGVRAREQRLDQGAIRIAVPTGGSVTQPAVDSSLWQVSPFLQTDVALGPRWKLLLGSSFDVNERSGLAVNPRATLSWWPWEALKLSATAGRGFRSPDLLQLYGIDVNAGGAYALLGNPDLEPERNTGYNVEAEWRLPGVTGFASYFRQDFEDLIGFSLASVCTSPGRPAGCIVDPLPGLPSDIRFQTENFAQALTQGVELGVEVSVLELLDVHSPYDLLASVAYSYLDSVNENGIEGEDGNQLPFRPPQQVAPALTLRRRDWGASLAVWGEYQSDTYTDVANSEDLIARNHWLFSFRFQIEPLRALPVHADGTLGRVLDAGRHLGFFAQGDNVFDVEYGPVTPDGRLAGPAAYLFGVTARY